MLLAKEFTVGTLADVKPVSLMLPRKVSEAPFLVGSVKDTPTAVSLGDEFPFHAVGCTNAMEWRGLVIPNVVIEVDERSLFDPQFGPTTVGAIIRIETRLGILARAEPSRVGTLMVDLEADLAPTHDMSAGFTKWRIVIGEGQDKRVLREVDTGRGAERHPTPKNSLGLSRKAAGAA